MKSLGRQSYKKAAALTPLNPIVAKCVTTIECDSILHGVHRIGKQWTFNNASKLLKKELENNYFHSTKHQRDE